MSEVAAGDQTRHIELLTEMVRGLRVANENATTQMDIMRDHMDRQAETLVKIAASLPKNTALDNAKVGKPDDLEGAHDAVKRLWKDWGYVFQNWFCSSTSGEGSHEVGSDQRPRADHPIDDCRTRG